MGFLLRSPDVSGFRTEQISSSDCCLGLFFKRQTAMMTFFLLSAFQHLLLERLCNSLCHSLSGYIIQTQLRHQQGNHLILCQLEQQRTESSRRRAFIKLGGGHCIQDLQTETHMHAHTQSVCRVQPFAFETQHPPLWQVRLTCQSLRCNRGGENKNQ